MMITSEARAHGLGAVSLRYFNVAGASGGQGERHAPETHIIPIALQVVAGRAGRRSRSTATTTRPRTAPASATTCTSTTWPRRTCWRWPPPRPGEHRIYNLGNGAGFSVREVVEAVRRVTGHPLPTEVGPRRPGDPAVLVAVQREDPGGAGLDARASPRCDEMVADAWTFVQSRP